MRPTKKEEDNAQNRDVTLNIRARRAQRDLIDEAAALLGTSRSDFMLSAACRSAEEVLLEKRVFALSAEDFKRFEELLDMPPSENPGLKALLNVKAPW
jgi:uncharacterized protein (DUF1778 family)